MVAFMREFYFFPSESHFLFGILWVVEIEYLDGKLLALWICCQFDFSTEARTKGSMQNVIVQRAITKFILTTACTFHVYCDSNYE